MGGAVAELQGAIVQLREMLARQNEDLRLCLEGSRTRVARMKKS